MKGINVLNYKPKEQIIEIVNRLSMYKLTKYSHGYLDYGDITIKEAVEKSVQNYQNKAKKRPAVSLIDVVLAANREYNKVVEPNINRILNNTTITTFNDLELFIKSNSKEEFYKFWGHKDEKKYNTLSNLLNAVIKLKSKSIFIDDFDVLNNWAINADIYNIKNDPIGKIDNIGLATFQHLRMVFGANTVKPDQRVLEVLKYEFDIVKASQLNGIKAVEQIADITGMSALEIDQIFVKYGSGYYKGSETHKLLEGSILKRIAKKLAALNVDEKTIIEATGIKSF